jgi:hypothetical protein
MQDGLAKRSLPMFSSILFPGERGPDSQGEAEKPEYFRDLYLDRIFDPILDRKKTFRLGAYFHRPVSDEATVAYRQAVLRDLEETAVQTSVAAFSLTVHDIAGQAEEIRAAVREKGGSFGTDYLLRGRLLDCADRYVQSIAKLDGLLRSPPHCIPKDCGSSGNFSAPTGNRNRSERCRRKSPH